MDDGSPTATSFQLSTDFPATADFLNGRVLVVNEEARRIEDYTVGRVVTLDAALSASPSNTDPVLVVGYIKS